MFGASSELGSVMEFGYKELIPKIRTLNNKDFIVHMLYKDI